MNSKETFAPEYFLPSYLINFTDFSKNSFEINKVDTIRGSSKRYHARNWDLNLVKKILLFI